MLADDASSRILQSPPGPSALIDGRRYTYFVGTGYLGLQGHPEVIRAACEAAMQYGSGSATTRAGFGATPPTLAVERLAAELLGSEAAFYLPTGYAAAGVLAAAVADEVDVVFLDELAHYSLAETAVALGRPVVRIHHASAEELRRYLQYLAPSVRPLVMTDGVFAARGTVAPLADYLELLADFPGGRLLVDDAHALGVLGASGRGTLEYFGLHANVNTDGAARLLCGTLSKAAGGYGGLLAGSRSFIARLKATSHWYDGASPLPPSVAAATAKGLELILAEPGLRTALARNVARLKDGLRRLGLAVDDTPVPIVCLALGRADTMRRIQEQLRQQGLLVAYLAAYAGLDSEGALRLAVFANHTEAMIDELVERLGNIL